MIRGLCAVFAALLFAAPAQAGQTRTAVAAVVPLAEDFEDPDQAREWGARLQNTAWLLGRQVQYDPGMALVKTRDAQLRWVFPEGASEARILGQLEGFAVDQVILLDLTEAEDPQIQVRRLHRNRATQALGTLEPPEGESVEELQAYEQRLKQLFEEGLASFPATVRLAAVDSLSGRVVPGARIEVVGAGVVGADDPAVSLGEGSYRVRVTAEGYVPSEAVLRVREGEQRSEAYTIDRYATLIPRTSRRALVAADGAEGPGRAPLRVRPGVPLDVIARKGARHGSVTVQLEPGETREVPIRLKR